MTDEQKLLAHRIVVLSSYHPEIVFKQIPGSRFHPVVPIEASLRISFPVDLSALFHRP